jgi:hypothetical protein
MRVMQNLCPAQIKPQRLSTAGCAKPHLHRAGPASPAFSAMHNRTRNPMSAGRQLFILVEDPTTHGGTVATDDMTARPTSEERMLTLDESQWQALQACDAHQFVAAVCDPFLAKRPELLINPGRDAILGRMQAAHDYAARIGFTSPPHIVWLMHTAADAPTLITDPAIEAYLREPDATPEQHLDDVAALMQKTVEGDL